MSDPEQKQSYSEMVNTARSTGIKENTIIALLQPNVPLNLKLFAYQDALRILQTLVQSIEKETKKVDSGVEHLELSMVPEELLKKIDNDLSAVGVERTSPRYKEYCWAYMKEHAECRSIIIHVLEMALSSLKQEPGAITVSDSATSENLANNPKKEKPKKSVKGDKFKELKAKVDALSASVQKIETTCLVQNNDTSTGFREIKEKLEWHTNMITHPGRSWLEAFWCKAKKNQDIDPLEYENLLKNPDSVKNWIMAYIKESKFPRAIMRDLKKQPDVPQQSMDVVEKYITHVVGGKAIWLKLKPKIWNDLKIKIRKFYKNTIIDEEKEAVEEADVEEAEADEPDEADEAEADENQASVENNEGEELDEET